MKKLGYNIIKAITIFSLLFVVSIPHVSASFSLVNQVIGTAFGSGGGTTSTIDTSGANLIVVAISEYAGSGGAGAAPTDSKGNTYLSAGTGITIGTVYIKLWYYQGTNVGLNHSFSYNTGTSYPVISVFAFSGSASTPLDQYNGNANAGVTSQTTGSITPSEDNELVITALTTTGSATYTVSGYTAQTSDYSSGLNMGGGSAYNIQTTAIATNPNWVVAAGPTDISAEVVSFKAAAGSPPPPPPTPASTALSIKIHGKIKIRGHVKFR